MKKILLLLLVPAVFIFLMVPSGPCFAAGGEAGVFFGAAMIVGSFFVAGPAGPIILGTGALTAGYGLSEIENEKSRQADKNKIQLLLDKISSDGRDWFFIILIGLPMIFLMGFFLKAIFN